MSNSFTEELWVAKIAYISKYLQYSDTEKCIRLLRPRHGTKKFSKSKIFVGVDFSLHSTHIL